MAHDHFPPRLHPLPPRRGDTSALDRALRQPWVPPRWRLPLALALVGGAFATVLLSGHLVRAQTSELLLGRKAPKGTPELPETFFDDEDADLESDESPRALHVVVDTPYEIWTGDPSYVHVVAWRRDFSPAVSATVYLDGRPVGVTDASGSLAFRQEFGEDDGGDHQIVVVQGDVRKRPLVGVVDYGANRRTASFEQAQLYVQTDRGVYQPGQTIHIRTIAWRLRGDYVPIVKQPVELTIKDSSGRVLTGARVITNRFGIASLDVPIPPSAPTDRYTLEVQSGQSVESSPLRIERFEPPAIDIRHDLARYATFDQPDLRFHVELQSFTGLKLDKGKLVAHLIAAGETVATVERNLDASDRYDVAFDEAAWSKVKKTTPDRGTFRVELQVTDSTGRVDVHKRDMILARNPYTVVVEQDKDEYARGEVAKIQVKSIDLDDRPVAGKKVRLVDLDTGKARTAKTGGNGIALFEVRAGAKEAEFDVFIEDVESPVGNAYIAIFGDKAMLSKVRVPIVRERTAVPIEVRIAPGFVPAEAWVHGDVVDSSGALVQAFRIPLRAAGDGYVASGTFVAPTWGTMLVTLFSVAHRAGASPQTAGLMVEGQQLTVEPDKALSITLGAPAGDLRPGQKVSVAIDVKDARGRPQTASIGASVVDSAVISMLDPLELNPRDRYYNPELKVLSTTGSKILTWPVVSRSWGESRMDIALPPFAFQEGIEPRRRHRKPAAKMAYGAKGGMGGILDDLGSVGTTGHGGGGGGLSGLSVSGAGYGGGGAPAVSAAKDASAPAPSNTASPHRAEQGSPAPAPRIVIRTDFRETALWEPELVADAGRLELTVPLPDAIGRQTVSVVASDERGGVGTARAELTVTQPLFVRSDLPPELVLGQAVEVRATVQNLSAKAAPTTLTLSSDALDITSPSQRDLTVPAGGTATATFTVKPRRAGSIPYRLEGRSARLVDVVDKRLFVRPEGTPQVEAVASTVTASTPWKTRLTFAEGQTVRLRMTFPGAPGLLERILAHARLENSAWLEAPGSLASTAAWMIQLLQRQGSLDERRLRALREAISLDLFAISLRRTRDGGALFLRNGRQSPYLTARALQAMTDARRADFLVPPAELTGAIHVLLDALGKDGLVTNDDVGWYEGKTTPRRLALTAEIFRIISEAGADVFPPARRPDLDRLAGLMSEKIDVSDDPLTLANATLGLLAYSRNFQVNVKIDPTATINRLQATRRQGHFEPSWFNAEGGVLETTAAVLELAQQLDPAAAQPLIRENLHVLLGARSGLGGWHNGGGTVAAIRALATLPPLTETRGGDLIVRVDGKPVLSHPIDPADPWGSALPIATIDLGQHLTPGAHDVEIAYAGSLEPVARIETTRFVAR